MNEIVKKNGINYGIITGVFSILVTALVYVFNLKLFTSMMFGLILLALNIIIGVLLLRKTKKDLKGVFSFKEAFTTYFISIIIGIPMSVLFSIILFNYIDPAAQDVLKEAIVKSTVDSMKNWNVPTAQINETIKKLQETSPFSTIELLKSTLIYIAFYSVIGLILAAIFKTKNRETL